jgi:hypothetical protein
MSQAARLGTFNYFASANIESKEMIEDIIAAANFSSHVFSDGVVRHCVYTF